MLRVIHDERLDLAYNLIGIRPLNPVINLTEDDNKWVITAQGRDENGHTVHFTLTTYCGGRQEAVFLTMLSFSEVEMTIIKIVHSAVLSASTIHNIDDQHIPQDFHTVPNAANFIVAWNQTANAILATIGDISPPSLLSQHPKPNIPRMLTVESLLGNKPFKLKPAQPKQEKPKWKNVIRFCF